MYPYHRSAKKSWSIGQKSAPGVRTQAVGPTRGAVIEIRNETPNDCSAIREVNERAFGGPAEARLVDLLRAANKVLISLVALHENRVVGHILFSPVAVVGAPEKLRAVGLARRSVLPELRNRGMGWRLVHGGL